MTPMPPLRRAALAALLLCAPSRAARAQDTVTVKLPDSSAAELGRIRVPPPVPPPWRFQLDLGFDAVGGNRDLTVANTSFVIERRPNDRLIFNLKLEARYGRSNGVEAVNNQLARLRFDWNPRRLVSPFIGLDVTRDPVRHSALRVQGGAGFNFNVNIRDRDRTWFSIGTLWDHETFIDSTAPKTDLRWMLRAATQRLIGQGTRIEALAKIQPAYSDAGDYLAAVEASIRVAISRRLGLSVKAEFKRDSRPAAGVEPDDRSLSAALSFGW